jgi:hypothetical protein
MSTDYRISKEVSASDLFGGRLERFGIREHVTPETSETQRCLTDGRNFVWVWLTEDNFVSCLTRYGFNPPQKILNAISKLLDAEIFSEYQPQYWGFDTQEEWDAAEEEMANVGRNRFYAELRAYVRGEPNDIRPGTVGEKKAEIAKKLVQEDATIIDDKDRLFAAIDKMNRPPPPRPTTPQEEAFWKLICTHEDDLPQA